MRKLALRVGLAVAGLSLASVLSFGQFLGDPGCPTTSWHECQDCCVDAHLAALAACPKDNGQEHGACSAAAGQAFEACLKACPSPNGKW
jgi:hypothetical protein